MFDAGKARMIGLPYGEKNYDDMLSRFHLIPERHGQTDGRTDRYAISILRVTVMTRDKKLEFMGYPTEMFIIARRGVTDMRTDRHTFATAESRSALAALCSVRQKGCNVIKQINKQKRRNF